MWYEVQQALHDSTMRVVTGIAKLLPGVLALIVALLISFVVAKLLSFLLRRSLRGINVEGKLSSWGLSTLSEVSPSSNPLLLITRCVFWGVMLLGFLIGVAAFDATLTSQLVMGLFAYLPNVFAAIVVFLVGNIAARFLARGVLIGSVNMNVPYGRLLSVGVKWLVLVLTAAMALDHLGVGGRVVDLAFAILFGGIVLALALAVGLGSKDLVTRSLERTAAQPKEKYKEQFHHL